MNKNDYIQKALTNISDKYLKMEIELELTNHIDDRISFYVDAGYDEDIAQSKAIELMGDPVTVGSQMNQLHNNKKIKISSIILIVINVLLWILISAYSYFTGGKINFEFFSLLASVIFVLLAKLKNPVLLKFFGITEGAAVLIYFSIFLSNYSEYFSLDLNDLFSVFQIAIDTIAPNLNEVISVCSYISLFLIILCSVFSIGYGCYISDELKGKVHTTLGQRFKTLSKFLLVSSIFIYLLPNVIILISYLIFSV